MIGSCHIQERRQVIGSAIGWSELVLPASSSEFYTSHFPLARIKDCVTVLTGANASGKSTQIEILGSRGVETYPEVLRELFTVARTAVDSITIARQAGDMFFSTGTCLHLEVLSTLSPKAQSPVVFDRGLGDLHGFFRLTALLTSPALVHTPLKSLVLDSDIRSLIDQKPDLQEIHESAIRQMGAIEELSKTIRYRRVLELQPLSVYERDEVRSKSPLVSLFIQRLIRASWKKLGYSLTPIPALMNDPHGRADVIHRIVNSHL